MNAFTYPTELIKASEHRGAIRSTCSS